MSERNFKKNLDLVELEPNFMRREGDKAAKGPRILFSLDFYIRAVKLVELADHFRAARIIIIIHFIALINIYMM